MSIVFRDLLGDEVTDAGCLNVVVEVVVEAVCVRE